MHKQSRRFLDIIYDNFLTQVVEKTVRRETLMDFIHTWRLK